MDDDPNDGEDAEAKDDDQTAASDTKPEEKSSWKLLELPLSLGTMAPDMPSSACTLCLLYTNRYREW